MVPFDEYSVNPDWDTLERGRAGDKNAWASLFRAYSAPLERMAFLLTGSTDTAKDLAQETFLRAMGGSLRHRRGTVKAYLTTILFRLSLKEQSRMRRNGRLEPAEIPSADPAVLDRLVDDEEQREVLRVLLEMPEHHRTILILRFHGGHSYEEIAAMTGLSLGTVKSRIFYAVKAGRKELKKRGIV